MMFDRRGRGIYRLRRLVLVIAVLFAIAGGVWGTGVFSRLDSSSSFTPPGSQSSEESNLSTQLFSRADADVVVLYRSATMTVQGPAYREAVTAALARIPAADVTRTTTYWSSGRADMVSADRHATYAVLKLLGVGMIVSLVVDATVGRVMLVPAVMRLLGKANWWAPRPLRRLYDRFGLAESEKPVAPISALPASRRLPVSRAAPDAGRAGTRRPASVPPDARGPVRSRSSRRPARSAARWPARG
jgi:uncharacterized membrane protein YdfJ with MMPL/SSD domain